MISLIVSLGESPVFYHESLYIILEKNTLVVLPQNTKIHIARLALQQADSFIRSNPSSSRKRDFYGNVMSFKNTCIQNTIYVFICCVKDIGAELTQNSLGR